MSNKFTPGTFSITSAGDEGVYITDEKGQHIALVHKRSTMTNYAHLIAATPNMFKVLELVHRESSKHKELEFLTAIVSEAIQKAKGE